SRIERCVHLQCCRSRGYVPMRRFLVISNLVFVVVGVATTMLGPLLPIHAARFGLSDQQLGWLFLAQFFGGFAGSIASTELSKRLGLRATIRLGLAVTALGGLGTTLPMLSVVLASVAAYGVGIGFCSAPITAAVSEASPTHRAGALNVLNFSWTVGAIVTPPFLTRLCAAPSIGFVGAMVAVATALALSAVAFPKTLESSSEVADHNSLSSGLLRLVIATGAVIFIYVGIENGVAGWLPTLALRVHQLSPESRAMLQGTFWTALLAGRLTAPLFLRSRSEQSVLRAAIVLAIAGTVGIIAAHGPFLFAAVFVTGFAFAPIFPTTIAYLSRHLGGQSGARLGWMFASAALGGAFVPYCVGTVSSMTGKLILGFSTLLVAECALLCANLLSAVQGRRLETSVQTAETVTS
ncbi:MAG TPA: MFS transporter, partial [Terriglobales bacterium]